jgi:AraC family transcriptional activator of mtrCDE
MDVISDVLKTVRFSGNVFLHTNFAGDWGARFTPVNMSVFHCVLFGSCWFGVEQDDSTMNVVQLGEGDVAFLPRGKTHFIANSDKTECANMQIMPGTRCMHTDIPDDKADVRVLCGVFQPVEEFQHPLFMTLPEFVHARFSEDAKDRSWGSHAAYAIDKAVKLGSPGMDVLIDRLYEVLFVQLLQQHYSGSDSSNTFYCSRNAPRIYRVLEAIHETPANRWTLDSMAELAHLSRSAFTSNFRETVGVSPMSYLTSWRMNLARSLLRTTGLPLDVIAKRVGFRTRAGFNKAFKQFFGIAPKKLRAQ